MWDGDADSAEAGVGIQEGAQLVHQQRYIHRVKAGRRQRCVVQCWTAAVGDRVAHNAKHLCMGFCQASGLAGVLHLLGQQIWMPLV